LIVLQVAAFFAASLVLSLALAAARPVASKVRQSRAPWLRYDVMEDTIS
jgi:hypothetical protein